MTAKTLPRLTEAQCQAKIVTAAHKAGWWGPFPERIASRIDFNGPGGCWIWTAELDRRGGYGSLSVPSDVPSKWRKVKAHRVVFEIVKGPISPGLVLDHLCRVPACVNPDHLDAVTQAVNIARGVSPAAVGHNTNTCRNGHVDDFCRRQSNGQVVYCRACRRERRRGTA